MKIPNEVLRAVLRVLSLARIVSEDSQLFLSHPVGGSKSSKDS